jgi:hypothetical protein
MRHEMVGIWGFIIATALVSRRKEAWRWSNYPSMTHHWQTQNVDANAPSPTFTFFSNVSLFHTNIFWLSDQPDLFRLEDSTVSLI